MNKRFLAVLVAVMMLLAFPYAFAEGDDDSADTAVKDSSSGSSDDVATDSSGSGSSEDKVESDLRILQRDDGGIDIRTRTEVRTREVVRDAAGKVVGELRTRLRTETRMRADKDEIMGRDVFKRLRVEQRDTLRKLNPDRLETLSQLRTDQIIKFRTVDKKRLRILASADAEALKNFARLEETDIEKVSKLDRSRIKKFKDLNPTEIRDRLKHIRVIKAENETEFRFRPLELEQTRRSEVAFNKLKENEEKLREKYDERKAKLVEIRDRVQTCKADPSSENCAAVDKDNLDRAKEHALSMVERLLNHLDKVKEKIGNSQDLPEDDVEAHLARINTLVDEVNALQSTIEAATEKAEFNEAVKSLRKIVSKVKKASVTRTQALVIGQTLGVIHRAEIMEKKLDCSLSTLEDDDVDTAEVDVKVAEFSLLIGDARANVEEAKSVYDRDDKEAVRQARGLLKDARDSAKDAQQKLVDLRKDILDLGGELCTEVDVAIDESEFEVEEPEEEEEVEVENETNNTDA